MIWEPFNGDCKWAVVIQNFSRNNSVYLNLELGDLVYLRRHTAEWYYGFKATCAWQCGAFPKVCVCISGSKFWPEFNAELQIMFSKMTSSFMAAELTRIDDIAGFIYTAIELKNSSSSKLSEREEEEKVQQLVTQLTLGQRELDLPILVRDEKFKPIDPYSELLVDLHKRYITLTKQLKDMKLKSEPFSVLLQFDHLPQAELVMYLASQPIAKEGNRGEIIGPTSFDPFVYEKGIPEAMATHVTDTYQPASTIKRLTDNVVINGYHRIAKDVVFTELNPVQPTEERILLVVMVNRLGSDQSKRGKSGKKSSSTTSQQAVESLMRRPYGVACADITRALVSVSKRTTNWFVDSTSLTRETKLGRTITITPITGEQFQAEAVMQLANQTPIAYWSPSREPSTIEATGGMSSASLGVQVLADADFELKSIELVNPLQYQAFSRNTMDSSIPCGRRYTASNYAPTMPDISRQEIYVTLVSGDFSKGPKQQEKNIEVEISLRDNSGNLVSDNQYLNKNPTQVFRSVVYPHKHRPKWSELFAIPLPASSRTCGSGSTKAGRADWSNSLDRQTAEQSVPGALMGSHLRFVCRHKGTNTDKVLGVAFLRLQPSTSIPVLLADGPYQLLVHSMDMNQIESCAYLRETSYISDPGVCGSGSSGSQGFSATTLPKQCSGVLSIETCICSSEHTTDEHLTKVIFWRNHQEDLHMSLRQGIYLTWKDTELRKFARPLVDSLIQILVSTTTTNGSGLRTAKQLDVRFGYSVLLALARCYRDLLITDKIRTYLLAPRFTYSTVHIPYLQLLNSILQDILVSELQAGLDKSGDTGNGSTGGNLKMSDVHTIFKTIYWAFLIIVRSRQLELQCINGVSDEGYTERDLEPPDGFIFQVDLFFDRAIRVISSANDQQMRPILLHDIPEVFRDILTVYQPVRLANALINLMNTQIQDSCGLQNRRLLENIIQSQLFDDPEARRILLFSVQQCLTNNFAEILSKQLVPGQKESNLLIETWCDLLLSFVGRVIQANLAESQANEDDYCGDRNTFSENTTTSELYELLITNGFLRWALQQLVRTYLFIKREEEAASRLDPSDVSDHRLSSRRIVYLPKGRVQQSTEGKPSLAYQRLTPILSCLASVVLSLLQQLDRNAWLSFLLPSDGTKAHSTKSERVLSGCSCNVCDWLYYMDLYDVLHELCSLFDLMHQQPPYPAPQISSPTLSSTQRSRATSGTLSLVRMNQGYANHHPGKRLTQLSDSWIEILAAASKIELNLMQTLIELLFVNDEATELPRSMLRPDHWLTMQLVYMIQQCLTSFVISQAHLSVEALPSVMRLRVDPAFAGWGVDHRQAACDLLYSLWRVIVPTCDDGINEQYVSKFLPAVIDIATVPLSSMRANCVNLIFEALSVAPEFIKRNFVSEVDRVMPWAGVAFAENLCRALEERLLQSHQESANECKMWAPLDETRRQLVTDLIRQVKVLVSYGEFFNHSSKMCEILALHDLRAVYEKQNRQDMSLRYLFRLESLHEQYGNDTERGYTLQAISKLYSWSDEPVDTGNISQQYCQHATSSRALREKLLLDALDCLKRGTDWERAIEVCDELIEFHRVIHPNYTKLGKILEQQLELFSHIVDHDCPRTVFYYYLLTFRGPGFPSFLLDTFVYRTKSTSTEVREMLIDQFPDATFTDVRTDSNDRSIIVATSLTPKSNIPEHLTSLDVDRQIKSYYSNNQVKCFSCIRHFPKAKPDLDVRAEETLYFVDNPMPNIMPIVRVKRVEKRTLNRTQLATTNVQDMIRQLEDHISVAIKNKNTKLMTGKLTSSIDSPVSGGLKGLVEGVDPSDDAGEESNFVKLGDSVMELLKLQLYGLDVWNELEKTNETEKLARLEIVKKYKVLIQLMSSKFGFSVTHLNADHLLYGPTATPMERYNGVNTPVTFQQPLNPSENARSLPRSRPRSVQPNTAHCLPSVDALQVPESYSSLRLYNPRTGSRPLDHIFPSGDATPVRSSTSDAKTLAQLLPSDPPPIPTRPDQLSKPDVTSEFMAGIERTIYDTNLTSMRVRRESVDVSDRTPVSPTTGPRLVDVRSPRFAKRVPVEEKAPTLPPRPGTSNR